MVTEYHGKFIAGRLCLDFVNTVGGRSATGAVIRDKIANHADLLAWGRAVGLPDIADGRHGKLILARAIALREALFRIFTHKRPAAGDIAFLRAEVAAATANQRLSMHAGRFLWTFANERAPDRILWEVALSAAALLTSNDLARVRECGGPECRWLFLDTSRNGRRRWCDMQDCGNRMKVQRFRARIKRD